MTDEQRELWRIVGDPDPFPTEGMTREQAVNTRHHNHPEACGALG